MPDSPSRREPGVADHVSMEPRRPSNAGSEGALQDGAARHALSTQESVEFIPTRGSKVTPPKPAANPLQFIKVGPCDLYKTAQEQIKKVEEVKKIKAEVRDEAEDWQSNLDNWKCGRRKRQEHIIERVVEVKKLELEEHDRNRRRSKTFNEMMEERNTRGRKASLMVYNDDEANDLSDLGIGTSSGDDNQSLSDRDDRSHNGNHGDDEMQVNDNSSLDTPYDRAIQNYVNFAETRIKTKNNINEDGKPSEVNGHKDTNGKTPPQFKPRRESSPKIEEKKAFLDERRRSSTELNSADKIKLVKVDVSKRKELFEKADNDDSRSPSKVSGFNKSKGIKERLSHLEKQGEANESKNGNRAASEISGTIKDRLTSLERQKSVEKLEPKEVVLRKRLSNGDVSTPQTVKERLSYIESQGITEETKTVGNKIPVEISIKERVSNLDSSVNKDIQKLNPDRDPSFHAKLANFQQEDIETVYVSSNAEKTVTGSERSSSPEDEIYATKRTQFHRSLDSLDREDDLANGGFERVQSLEDIECLGRRHYPPSASSTEMLVFSSQSGDTDREDSGIHTADVSSSVSQADEPVEDVELIGGHLEVDGGDVSHRRQPSELSEQTSPLPPIQEMYELTTTFGVNFDEGQERSQSQSDDEPVEAVIASRASHPEDMMLATREVTLTSAMSPPAVREERDVVEKEEREVVQTVAQDVAKMQIEEDSYVTETVYGNGYSVETKVHTHVTTSEILPLNLSSEVEMLSGELSFPLGPPTSAEPPKEKPPPPPTDLSDEESSKPKASLRRVDSTKRIKKEIRRKRSDFLGIEGNTDDSYLEPVLSIAPDMTAFLIEEQRQQKLLYRQSICSESDSNPGESRDSGVELERHVDDHWLGKQVLTPDMSAQHSRQESELYGNTSSVTSEEDEITKKEREIIEMLEKEEQWRYANNNSTRDDIGEKLAEKLRQLEQEKLQLEWDRAEEERRRMAEENARREETLRLRAKEQDLRKQENNRTETTIPLDQCGDGNNVGEVIRAERERLQQEQEELVNQRENLIMRETQQLQRNMQQWDVHPSSAVSLQDVSRGGGAYQQYGAVPPVVPPAPLHYRLSLPDLQEQRPAVHRAPPPIPPTKPNRTLAQQQQQQQRDVRTASPPDSAQSRHVAQAEGVQLRRNQDTRVDNSHVRHSTGSAPQQMTRQTLQALSAAPRSRIVSTDNWIQAKKKPESQRNSGQSNPNYNYQHWLIQEAEHRRITEQQQRNAPQTPRKAQPTPPRGDKPLPDAIIQTLTQRVQNRAANNDNKNSPTRRDVPTGNHSPSKLQNGHPANNGPPHGHTNGHAVTVANGPSNGHISVQMNVQMSSPGGGVGLGTENHHEKMLSVSGKKKCSHCSDELGRGAAMIIESLRLFYHIDCFKCCVCHVQLGDGLMGTDVRVRNNKLHCHNCYSSDDGVKFSCV